MVGDSWYSLYSSPLSRRLGGALPRDVTESHHSQEHGEHFAVAQVVLGEAFSQQRQDRSDCSMQDEARFWVRHLSAQSPREVPQDFHDQPKKEEQRRKPALSRVLQVDVEQMPVLAHR
jgi:hypothetical protein